MGNSAAKNTYLLLITNILFEFSTVYNNLQSGEANALTKLQNIDKESGKDNRYVIEC